MSAGGGCLRTVCWGLGHGQRVDRNSVQQLALLVGPGPESGGSSGCIVSPSVRILHVEDVMLTFVRIIFCAVFVLDVQHN
jgi:hypothetical protein